MSRSTSKKTEGGGADLTTPAAARLKLPRQKKGSSSICEKAAFFSWRGRCGHPGPVQKNGSSSRTRTCDGVVNSHLLYRLSYAGAYNVNIFPFPFFSSGEMKKNKKITQIFKIFRKNARENRPDRTDKPNRKDGAWALLFRQRGSRIHIRFLPFHSVFFRTLIGKMPEIFYRRVEKQRENAILIRCFQIQSKSTIWRSSMGRQYNKVQKRARRQKYLERVKARVKASVKTSAKKK